MKNHYNQPQLLESILSSIKATGLNLSKLNRQDISGLDEFHLQGAEVSLQLANKLELKAKDRVLDVGCGIGGPCRMLADEFGCQVTGIDYTNEYIRVAKTLSELVGLEDKTTFIEANALNLPFADNNFDVVWTQHVQMNIADKAQFYAEIQRVLKPGGTFIYYDIFGTANSIFFPVPWAEVPEMSHLVKHGQISQYFDTNQWQLSFTEDHTSNAINALTQLFENIKAGNPPKLGLNLLMRDTTKEKLNNLFRCLKEGRVEVHAGIYSKS